MESMKKMRKSRDKLNNGGSDAPMLRCSDAPMLLMKTGQEMNTCLRCASIPELPFI